ncbi:DUF4240 domain-containing protein [Streptomyces sp. NPDC018947]|uniref:DUF4240 domain-containing protein n=1 Tax=Streptomyces sp. NPDC018947 TaxID=3365054 RepID=UPI0037A67D20
MSSNLRARAEEAVVAPGGLPAMGTEAFWHVLDAAKDSAKPLDVAVDDHLSALPAEEILAFEHRFSRLRDVVYRWNVWAAAYRIGGGCSHDRFSDFTAGLVALGREWCQRAAACPDALADHPAVRIAAAAGDQDVIFDENLHFVSSRASERLTGDSDAFGRPGRAGRPTPPLAPRPKRGTARGWASRSTREGVVSDSDLVSGRGRRSRGEALIHFRPSVRTGGLGNRLGPNPDG